MPHYLTNRGKFLLINGEWADSPNTIRAGYFQSGANVATFNSAGGTSALNFVADFVNAGGTGGKVAEANFTNYPVGRYQLSQGTGTNLTTTEVDASNWVALDCPDWVIASAGGATPNTLAGVFFYSTSVGTTDADFPLISIDFFASTITTNGGSLTYAITDLYRVS